MKLKPNIHQLLEFLLILGIVILIIFLPSFVDNRLMNGIQSGKTFFFTFAILGIILIWTVSLIFRNNFQFQLSIIDLLLVFFVAWVSINKFLLHEFHALSLRYFELLGLLVLYFIIRTLNSKDYIFLLLAICIGGIIQAIYGNLQLWGYYPSHHGNFKMTGSFFNPGPFAGFLCCILPIAVGLYLNYRKHKVDFNVFEASRLRSLKLTSFTFEKLGSVSSNNQTIFEENHQTSSIERVTSNSSNIIEQLLSLTIKYIALISIIAILLVLPAARSRAAWLGAIAGVVFLAWHRYNISELFKRHPDGHLDQTFKLFKRDITLRKRTIVAILALVLLAGSLSLYHFKKDSADGRLLIWKVTSNIIKDYPILGVGQNLLPAFYMEYQAEYFKAHPGSKYEAVADDNQYAFNEFLNVWVENGIIGLLLIGGLVFVLFFKGKDIDSLRVRVFEGLKVQRSSQETSSLQTLSREVSNISNIEESNPSKRENFKTETILRSSLLAIIVFSMFAYPSEILPIKLIAIICLGLLANYYALDLSNLQKRSLKSEASNFSNAKLQTFLTRSLKLALTGFALLITVAAFPKANELRQMYKTWKDAFELYNFGLFPECLEDYQKAFPLLQYNGEFLINFGKALSIAEKHKESIETLSTARNFQTNSVLFSALGDSQKALKQYNEGEKDYWRASEMAPGKFYPKYLLAKLYDETNQQQKVIEVAISLLKKEIKIESTAITEIHVEMEKIIEKNTSGESQLISNKENTTNRQKGRNNHTSLQKTAMVTLPIALSINQSSTPSGTNSNRKEVR